MENKDKNFETLPNDIEAEQAVLSCMIFDADGISMAYEMLKPEDFYRLEHKQIFEAIVDMYSQGQMVDIITLKNKLEIKKVLEKNIGISKKAYNTNNRANRGGNYNVAGSNNPATNRNNNNPDNSGNSNNSSRATL